jgi:uncharacterized protein YkwD
VARPALAVTRVTDNIAMSNYPPGQDVQQVLDGWFRSAGHRGNMEGSFESRAWEPPGRGAAIST